MSRRRRQDYNSCSVNAHEGRLRLRYRVPQPDGTEKQASWASGLMDTTENRKALDDLARLVGATVRAGLDPRTVLENARTELTAAEATGEPPVLPTGPTVESYYRPWYAERAPHIRPSLARKYRQHMEGLVLPAIGPRLLADLKPKDLRGLQAELLAHVSPKTGRVLAAKTVKNILCGTLQAMIGQAQADELVLCDPFVGLKWGRWEHEEADPLEPAERDQTLAWFRDREFSFHAGRGGGARLRPHPHYHAYLHFLFWHGARPSEASGLQWRHVDLRRGTVHVRQSYNEGKYGKPKTKNARRTIELHPDTVELLRAVKPLRESPEAPVFITTTGGPIEPKNFSEHWYACLRALGIRQRGLYCCKDTFVSIALACGRDDVLGFLVNQTGVALQTLRQHYAAWLPKSDGRRVWAALDPSLANRRRPLKVVGE
jgi:integrase